MRKSRGCEIVGTKGVLVWHSDGKAPERCVVRLFERGSDDWQVIDDIREVDTSQPYRDLMKAFLTEIEQPGTTSLSSAADAARVLEVALAALESASDRGTAREVCRYNHRR